MSRVSESSQRLSGSNLHVWKQNTHLTCVNVSLSFDWTLYGFVSCSARCLFVCLLVCKTGKNQSINPWASFFFVCCWGIAGEPDHVSECFRWVNQVFWFWTHRSRNKTQTGLKPRQQGAKPRCKKPWMINSKILFHNTSWCHIFKSALRVCWRDSQLPPWLSRTSEPDDLSSPWKLLSATKQPDTKTLKLLEDCRGDDPVLNKDLKTAEDQCPLVSSPSCWGDKCAQGGGSSAWRAHSDEI